MIIVKTKNGAVLINDKETHLVDHIKDKGMVVVHSDHNKVNITGVESVTYVSDAHATEWKDEGLEVERLKAELENVERERHIMSVHIGYMHEWLFTYQYAFDDIKDNCQRADRRQPGIYTNLVAIIEQAEKKYQESQKRYEKVLEKWEKKE